GHPFRPPGGSDRFEPVGGRHARESNSDPFLVELRHSLPAMPESIAPEKLSRKTKNVAQLLQQRVSDTPDRESLRYPVGDEWRSMTWRQVGERVKSIAAGLLALGLAREQRVGILSNTRFEWLLCDLGILSAGGAT